MVANGLLINRTAHLEAANLQLIERTDFLEGRIGTLVIYADAGPPGANGTAGLPGPPGASGLTGANGTDRLMGDDGAVGPQGANGTAGQRGVAGPPG